MGCLSAHRFDLACSSNTGPAYREQSHITSGVRYRIRVRDKLSYGYYFTGSGLFKSSPVKKVRYIWMFLHSSIWHQYRFPGPSFMLASTNVLKDFKVRKC